MEVVEGGCVGVYDVGMILYILCDLVSYWDTFYMSVYIKLLAPSNGHLVSQVIYVAFHFQWTFGMFSV